LLSYSARCLAACRCWERRACALMRIHGAARRLAHSVEQGSRTSRVRVAPSLGSRPSPAPMSGLWEPTLTPPRASR
jgi:hypothetical protein